MNKDRMTESIENTLNKLEGFVTWDRWSGELNDCAVFGWIKRLDDKFDFVVIRFVDGEIISFDTSSAKFSHTISDFLGFDGHDACKRVEHSFTGVHNVMHLK